MITATASWHRSTMCDRMASATPLTASQARILTERIRHVADDLWRLLLEAYERRAWEALGYTGWRAYVKSEFGMSQQRSYQLLSHARIVRAVEEAGVPVPTTVGTSEGATRALGGAALAKDLDEVRGDGSSSDVAEKVAAIVGEYRERKAAQASKPTPLHPALRAIRTLAAQPPPVEVASQVVAEPEELVDALAWLKGYAEAVLAKQSQAVG